MSLIDRTYFVADIAIPYNANTQALLDSYIARFEKEVLIQLLGYDLYLLVAAYDDQTSPQRIIDIVEGKQYAATESENVKWEGLANSLKISLISYYVYYHYVRDHNTLLMPVGNVKSSQENSALADVSHKLAAAWYSMRELAGYPGQHILAPSLYNFLLKNEADYPEWEYQDIGTLNAFGI